jgi:hypothetical protein
MKQSDDVCTVELGRMVSDEAMVNTGLSFGTSALSTAATVVTGKLTKSILAGGSSLFNATRENFDSQVYRNVMSTAIATAIEKERAKDRAAILGHFEDSSVKYPVDRMVMDVNEYHQTCSFYHGLTLVLTAVSKDQNTTQFASLSAEISSVKQERDDLIARAAKAGAKEKEEIQAELVSKEQTLANLENERTKLVMPDAVSTATSDATADKDK